MTGLGDGSSKDGVYIVLLNGLSGTSELGGGRLRGGDLGGGGRLLGFLQLGGEALSFLLGSSKSLAGSLVVCSRLVGGAGSRVVGGLRGRAGQLLSLGEVIAAKGTARLTLTAARSFFDFLTFL